MKKHKPYIFLITFTFFSMFSILHAGGATEQIPLDPAVHAGTLENGLQYYVRENRTPEKRAYLRLVINAGSTQEDDDQLGMAHLLEHMAFNGTRNYQENDLVKYLQGIGMQFGPDINAHTSFDETVYKLTIPLEEPENLETGLQILEEWAFHMNLRDEDIDQERGVILEEWRQGLGASRRMMNAAYPDIMYNSLYAERLPIGTEESIKTSTPDAIRRFYRDWYRPELMSVVAVGDFDAEPVIQMIQERFSPYSNPPLPRERTEAAVPLHNETIYSIQSDKEATWTAAIIFNKFSHDQIRTEEDYRKEIVKELYIRMFNNRLAELLDQPDPPFTYGYVDFTSLSRDKSFHTMTVLTSEEGFYKGYETLLYEEKKLKDHGFSPSELDRAVKELTSEFQSIYENRNNIESVQIVDWYTQHFLDRQPAPGIEYQWRIFQKYAGQITTTEISELAQTWLSKENRVIYTMAPKKEDADPIDPVKLSGIHFRIDQSETEKPLDQSVAEQLMSELPSPGEILEKNHFEKPDVYEWTLGNGAKVVLKQTDFKDNEVLFSAMAPGGLSLSSDADFISASFADQAVIQSGAGGYSKREIEKILAGSTAQAKPMIRELTSGFRGSSAKEDLDDLLQLVYLYFTAPGKDEMLWQSYQTRLNNSLANRDSNPMTQYSDLITKLLYQDHPRSQPLTVEKLKEFQLDQALDFYKERFSNATGFTFFFTGSISPEELEEYIQTYLASLPSGEGQKTWVDREVRYPEGVITDNLNKGIEPLSYVTMIYTGIWEWSDRETAIFQAVADSLDIILTEEIRERASGTYSPSIRANPAKVPFEDYDIVISFSCDPARTEELTGMVKEILDDIKNNLPEQRITDDVIKSRQVYLEEQLQKNNFWLSRMERDYFLDMPRDMIVPQDYLSGEYTPAVLQDRVKRYFNPENYLEVVLHPAEE